VSITIVGTIGIDSIYTPFDQAEKILGGSASYFSLAAALFDHVNMVAVAGRDLSVKNQLILQAQNIDTTGLELQDGETFRWGGRYHLDFNSRDTLFTELGVLATFDPTVPPSYQTADVLFLANLTPSIQQSVVRQVPHAKLRALDTMNYWIDQFRPDLTQVLHDVQVVIMAEDEVRQFAGVAHLRKAAKVIFDCGPNILVIKQGSYGALLLDATGGYFAAPAFPLDDIVDPTGAGDAFAGGFLGSLSAKLAAGTALKPSDFQQAVLYGNIMGAFACEDFGVNRLLSLTTADIQQRYQQLVSYTHLGSSY